MRFYFTVVIKIAPFNDEWVQQRYEQALDFLPVIAKTSGPVILTLGASDIERSFNPIFFDEELNRNGLQTTSFNFGFMDQGPTLFKLFAERVFHELNQRHAKKVSAILVKMIPATLTHKFAANFYLNRLLDEQKCALNTTSMLLQNLLSQPEETARLLFLKLALNCHSPAASNRYVGAAISHVLERFKVKPSRSENYESVLNLLWYRRDLDLSRAWDTQTRGFFNWGLPQVSSVVVPLLRQVQDPSLLQWYIETADERIDLVDLSIDDQSTEELISGLRRLSQVTERLYIIYWPTHPILNYRPETLLRINNLLHQLQQKTSAQILDYSDHFLKPEDYYDIFHLSEQGGQKVMTRLAHDLAADLKN